MSEADRFVRWAAGFSLVTTGALALVVAGHLGLELLVRWQQDQYFEATLTVMEMDVDGVVKQWHFGEEVSCKAWRLPERGADCRTVVPLRAMGLGEER